MRRIRCASRTPKHKKQGVFCRRLESSSAGLGLSAHGSSVAYSSDNSKSNPEGGSKNPEMVASCHLPTTINSFAIDCGREMQEARFREEQLSNSASICWPVWRASWHECSAHALTASVEARTRTTARILSRARHRGSPVGQSAS